MAAIAAGVEGAGVGRWGRERASMMMVGNLLEMLVCRGACIPNKHGSFEQASKNAWCSAFLRSSFMNSYDSQLGATCTMGMISPSTALSAISNKLVVPRYHWRKSGWQVNLRKLLNVPASEQRRVEYKKNRNKPGKQAVWIWESWWLILIWMPLGNSA